MSTQLIANHSNYTKGLPSNNSTTSSGGGAQNWRKCTKWDDSAHIQYVRGPTHPLDQCVQETPPSPPGWDYTDVYIQGQPAEYVFPKDWYVVAGLSSSWEVNPDPTEQDLACNSVAHQNGNIFPGALQNCRQLVETDYDGTKGHLRVRVDVSGTHNYPDSRTGGSVRLVRCRTTKKPTTPPPPPPNPGGTKAEVHRACSPTVSATDPFPAVSAVCIFLARPDEWRQQFEIRTADVGKNLRVIFKHNETSYEWYYNGQDSWVDNDPNTIVSANTWHRLLLNMWYDSDGYWSSRFRLQRWVSGAWSLLRDFTPRSSTKNFGPISLTNSISGVAFGDENLITGNGTVYYEATYIKRADTQSEFNQVTAGEEP